MLLKLGPLAAEVAGSIGGMTLQRSPLGTVARSKPLPTIRRSKYPQSGRARMARALQVWRTLDANELQLWNIFAQQQPRFNRFGDPVTPTAYWAFMRANTGAHVCAAGDFSQPITRLPPANPVSDYPHSARVVLGTPTPSLAILAGQATLDPKTRLYIFASAPIRTGRQYARPRMPLVGVMDPSRVFPFDFSGYYALTHGRLPVAADGETCTVRLKAWADGGPWPGLEGHYVALV